MSNREQAEKIIRSHVLWSMGAGLIPLPLFDIAAVTAIQADMLNQLAGLYGVDFSKSMGKSFVAGLTGSTFAKIGASFIKAIPGVGTLIGGLSMSAMSGASTYAVGQVAINYFESGGDFLNVNMEQAKASYEEMFEKGKEFVAGLKEQEAQSKSVFQSIEELGKLRDQGLITEEEFEAKKKELLDRL